MKKNSIRHQNPSRGEPVRQTITIGMDLGDRTSRYCALDGRGEVREGSVATTQRAMRQKFGSRARCRIAIEVGARSRWVSRLLTELGHEVFVATRGR